MNAEVTMLAERVRALEKQVRRTRQYAGAFGLGLAALATLAAAPPSSAPDTIEARRFVARDAQGHARMIVGVDAHGAGYLALEDSDGSSMLMSRGDAYLKKMGIDPEIQPDLLVPALKKRCDEGRDGEACYALAEFYDPTRNVLSSLQALTSPSQAAVYYGKACAAGFEPGCREEKAAARPD